MASKNLPVDRFDSDWNLTADIDEKGAMTASREAIAAAQLILIKNDQRKLIRINEEIRDGINTVRHFFHRLGERKLKRLIDEAFRKADLQRARRLRWNKSRKAKRAKGRP